jgi:hypothetical protein
MKTMMTNWKNLLAMGSMTAAIGFGNAPAARAQEATIVAKVPVAFVVGDVHLPAGEYVVRDVPDSADVVEVERADGTRGAIALTIPTTPSSDAKIQPTLVFRRFANEYFLVGINAPGGDAHEIVLTQSMMERAVVDAADHQNR